MSIPTYSAGQTIDLGPEVVTDSNGNAATASAQTVTVRAPDGTTSTPAVTGAGGASGYDASLTVTQIGLWSYEWDFTLGGDHAVRTGQFYVAASPFDPRTGDLTDLGTVRGFLQSPAGDVEQDAVIGQLITAASRAIATYLGREIGATGAATRRFEMDASNLRVGQPARLDLAPYDLRAITTLKVDPETAAPTTLVQDTDYRLLPVTKADGVWSAVRIFTLPATSPTTGRDRIIEIDGTWGFPAVPAEVQHWCNVTVATWLRRDVSAFSSVFNIDENQLERPASLPAAAIAGLAHLRRLSVT